VGVRQLATTALCAAAAAAFVPPAFAASPEEELAAKYAPVVRLVEQEEECGYGEPYQPTDVDVLFGSDEVVLRGPWDTTNVAKIAPLAADLTASKVAYHLDFPGNALEPGCAYEQWSKRITTGTRPTTYARVVPEPARPGTLALQYWLFYVYNDFNNKHEGDWEMIQLVFDVGSAGEALGSSPTSVGYSQHEGAERAAWGEDKLELVDGTHPVVYSAAGSHANYFDPALFLGRSAAQGVGCDDTTEPSRDLRPIVAFVPTDEAAYLRAFPWLGFTGNWGELRPAFYNGPTGPNAKQQWTEPISWSEETWRDSAYAIPAGSSLGTSATDFFCSAVAAGSDLLTSIANNPGPTLLVLGGIVALLFWAASQTSWSAAAPLRLARRRAWGEIVTSAWRMYGRRFWLFAAIGFVFVPLGFVITFVQYLLFRIVAFAPLVDSAGESNVVVAGLAFDLGLLLSILGLTVVQAATAQSLRDIDEGRSTGALDAYRAALDRVWSLLGGLVLAALVVFALTLTLVGIPIAIWLVVRWSLFAQAVQLEGRSALSGLRRSGALVRGSWWRAATITLVVTGIGLLVGPLLGAILLFVSDASFNLVNLVAALVYTIALPFAAIATTYLYHDLRVREALEARGERALEILPAEI
jgi:hypothetical protein